MEIRALRPSDDRSGFHSGDEALDRFFHRYAGQNQFRHHLGRDLRGSRRRSDRGIRDRGPRHIDIDELPARLRKKLPRYPIPVLGLARLAVDASAQSIGLGSQLLRFVLQLAANMAENVGCAGVVVDAKPGAIAFYAKYGLWLSSPWRASRTRAPSPPMMWLPIQAIRAANEPVR